MFKWQWVLGIIAILLGIFKIINILLQKMPAMPTFSFPRMTGLIHVFGLVYDSIIHKINRIPEYRPGSAFKNPYVLLFIMAGFIICGLAIAVAVRDLPHPG